MSTLKSKNLEASIRARLKNISQSEHRDFNAVLLQYFQERFLYRLSVSHHKELFILKGGMLFLTYNIPVARPTKDIDFLGVLIKHDAKYVVEKIVSICEIECADGVVFDANSIITKVINENETYEYEGINITLVGMLGKIRLPFSIDIGVGDTMVTAPHETNFPVILDMPVPRIKTYTKDTVIAEKFQTMVVMGIINSRMKDFFDILFLLSHFEFESGMLKRSISETFKNRHTDINERNYIFSGAFKNDALKQTQWNAFLYKHNIEAVKDFPSVIDKIERFLVPLFEDEDAISSCLWDFQKQIWIKIGENLS